MTALAPCGGDRGAEESPLALRLAPSTACCCKLFLRTKGQACAVVAALGAMHSPARSACSPALCAGSLTGPACVG